MSRGPQTVTSRTMEELALVMSGGGARAAYQVGCLRTIARHFPTVAPPILTGVSAGAINAAFLASRQGPLAGRLEELTELWRTLEPDKVFQVGSFSLARNVLRTGTKLMSGGLITAPRPSAFVDTSPLRELLEERMGGPDGRLRGVDENIESGSAARASRSRRRATRRANRSRGWTGATSRCGSAHTGAVRARC